MAMAIVSQLGISQSTYKGFELVGEANGRELSIKMIVKIARVLNVETDYLLGIKDYKTLLVVNA